MTDLIERYVHQVGLYMPRSERADIEAELRSSIRDQAEDRFGESPTQADIAAILTDLGDPYHMAASYNHGQSLVGPGLYPYLMMILRRVWVIVPTLVIFLTVFRALTAPQQGSWSGLLVEALFAIVQGTFLCSALVVLIFAIIERVSARVDRRDAAFDPLRLPKVNDPRIVERSEVIIGVVLGVLVLTLLLYFLSAGGLTLPFGERSPDSVIPVPMLWLLLLAAAVTAMNVLHLRVLHLNRWTAALYLIQTILEVFGMICLYFMFYTPVFARLTAATPALANVPFINSIPQILVIITALSTLAIRGSRLVALWNYRDGADLPMTAKPNL
jgi:hypothetical protein